MGSGLEKFNKEIEDSRKIGTHMVSSGQINSYEIDANAFTGEVELHTYVVPVKPIKFIRVNLQVNKPI